MLASIKTSRINNDDVVTVELKDGRKIVGQLDERDKIHIIENTMNLEGQTAECVAGIAYVNCKELGEPTMVWHRLLDQAVRCQEKLQELRYLLN